MSTRKFYDTFTLSLKSGPATEAQIVEAFDQAIKTGRRLLEQELDNKALMESYFKFNREFNVVVDRNGTPLGVTYIRVSSPAIYHMLCGRNPDGTQRLVSIPDPNWSPRILTPEIEEQFQQRYNNFENWNDLIEEEESYTIAPIVTVSLNTLMPWGNYTLTPEQEIQYQNMVKNAKKSSYVAPKGVFEISPASVDSTTLVDNSGHILEPNVLVLTIPKEVISSLTETQIRNRFARYNTSGNNTFPLFKLDKQSGVGYVIFNPKGTDGQFAIKMIRVWRVDVNGKRFNVLVNNARVEQLKRNPGINEMLKKLGFIFP